MPYRDQETTCEAVERHVAKQKWTIVLLVLLFILLYSELTARGTIGHISLPSFGGGTLQQVGGAQGQKPQGQQSTRAAALMVNTPQSLGEVMDMLISLSMTQYFTALQKAGYTNLHAIASSQGSCPPSLKPFHCKLIRREAYMLLLPEGSAEKEKHELEHPDLIPTPKEVVEHAICNSWANTRGVHQFMSHQKKTNDTYMHMEVPVCAKARIAPRGVLYSAEQDMDGSGSGSGSGDGDADRSITAAVAEEKGWFQNDLSLKDVQALRERGLLRQMLFDHRRKTMFCGVPKASVDVLDAWQLDGARLWNERVTLNESIFSGRLNRNFVTAQHMDNHDVLEALNSGGYFKFTFVRDPFTRALTAFDDKLYDCTRKRAGKECRHWMWLLTGMRVRRAKVEGYTFREYVKLLQKKNYQEYDVDVTYQTAHWLSQTHVCALDRIAYDFIGRTENSDKDIQTLYDIVGHAGLDSRHRWLLSQSQRIESKAHHYGADSASIQSNVEGVRAVYDADFQLLGYKGEELFKQLQRGHEEDTDEMSNEGAVVNV